MAAVRGDSEKRPSVMKPMARDMVVALLEHRGREGDHDPQVRQGLVVASGAKRPQHGLEGRGRGPKMSAALRRCLLIGPPVGVGKEGRDGSQEWPGLVAHQTYWQVTEDFRRGGASDEVEDSDCRAAARAGRLP